MSASCEASIVVYSMGKELFMRGPRKFVHYFRLFEKSSQVEHDASQNQTNYLKRAKNCIQFVVSKMLDIKKVVARTLPRLRVQTEAKVDLTTLRTFHCVPHAFFFASLKSASKIILEVSWHPMQ